ncbi:uncharacterized protein [Engystomops pustulosus]|uniref:uncharacterized protein n=1 Tax=Engystomops pustulosus TaxID=76066 RepID=UPI003AFADB18
MSTNTFFYTEEVASQIIDQVTLTSQFLQIPSTELKTREFEKEYRKFTSLKLHCATLTEYYKVERIPRGLRSHLYPTLFKDDPEFCKKFENILNKCSFDLILLTVETLQKKIAESSTNLKSIEQQLSTSLSPEEWSKLREKVDRTISEFRLDTENKKRQKFLRDTEDYQQKRVYKWQDPNFQSQRFQRRTYRRSSSSSGERSTDSRNSHFFLRRQHRSPYPRPPVQPEKDDQRDEGARPKIPPPHLQTRSQKK